MRSRLALASLVLLGLAALRARPVQAGPATYDAPAAYAEFEATLREAYAYLDRPDLDVEAHLARGRAAAAGAVDSRALRAVLREVTVAFTDPHLLVTPLEDTDPNVWPTSGDLAIAAGPDGYEVADVRAGSAADEAGLRPGWRLASVDGAPIADAVAKLLRLVPAPTPEQLAYAATLAANGRRTGTRRLGLVAPGGPREVELPNPRELAKAVAARPPLELAIDGEVGVLRLNNSLGRLETIAAVDSAIARCAGLDGLVIDLRNTPSGGNTDVARGLMGHFVSEPRPYQVHEVPAVERRTTVPRRFVEYVLPRAPRFPGRVAVLGGRWTGSMGEGTLIGLHAAAGARTFASDLGDLLGALHTFPLPLAGGTLELGAEALFHVDGTPRGEYVADVPLPSADRDADGGDPALRAARAWLRR